MDYKSVDKAYRWRRSDVYLESWLETIAEGKGRLQKAKNNEQTYLKRLQSCEDWGDATPMEKLAIQKLDTLMVNLHKQKLKINIYVYNGDLRNCIKSFEKFKELSCDVLEEVEERVQRNLSEEGTYLEICTSFKEQVEFLSAFLKERMECYKGGCGCST